MLRHIPFYGSLMQQPFKSGAKPSSGHVLVYGAIEAHSMGDKGCIASNKTIGEELGLSQGRVANIISELNSEGWIRVNMINGNRANIEPLLTITTPSLIRDTLHVDVNPPSRRREPPLHVDVNIEHRGEHSENNIRQVDVVSSDELTPLIESIKGILETPRARVTPGRLRKLKARLRTFNGEEVERAARNLAKSKWHMGENPNNVKYASVDFLLRSDEQVDKWLNYEVKEILFAQ